MVNLKHWMICWQYVLLQTLLLPSISLMISYRYDYLPAVYICMYGASFYDVFFTECTQNCWLHQLIAWLFTHSFFLLLSSQSNVSFYPYLAHFFIVKWGKCCKIMIFPRELFFSPRYWLWFTVQRDGSYIHSPYLYCRHRYTLLPLSEIRKW